VFDELTNNYNDDLISHWLSASFSNYQLSLNSGEDVVLCTALLN